MKRNLSLWQFGGFCITALFGTLLHFLYDWTHHSIFVAPFAAVNESTWEHMKLLFFPMFIFSLIQSRYFKEYKSFWCIKLLSTLLGLFLIPALFYTYNGAIGKSPDWVNVTIFFISAAIVYITETCLFKSMLLQCKSQWLFFAAICLIGVLFVVFTFATPQIPLFQDSTTRAYGVS